MIYPGHASNGHEGKRLFREPHRRKAGAARRKRACAHRWARRFMARLLRASVAELRDV